MEKSLDTLLSWAEVIVVTQAPNAESKKILANSPVPVINVAAAEPATIPALTPAR